MTQNQEFDIPGSIERLAGAKLKCTGAFLRDTLGRKIHDWDCPVCSGTGYYVPFASLRTPCSVGESMVCSMCHNRGWRPEPDVEKARMRVIATLQQLCGITLTLYRHGEAYIDFHTQVSEPVRGSLDIVPFRAAEAWLEEKP